MLELLDVWFFLISYTDKHVTLLSDFDLWTFSSILFNMSFFQDKNA